MTTLLHLECSTYSDADQISDLAPFYNVGFWAGQNDVTIKFREPTEDEYDFWDRIDIVAEIEDDAKAALFLLTFPDMFTRCSPYVVPEEMAAAHEELQVLGKMKLGQMTQDQLKYYNELTEKYLVMLMEESNKRQR